MVAEAGFYSPPEIAEKVVGIAEAKSKLSILKMIVLGIFAGVYIGFGAELATMVTNDTASFLGVGVAKFLGGSVFAVGLMLVVIGGSELFTGNNLIMTGVLRGKVHWLNGLLRNWFWVYLANFAGSLLLVWFMYGSQLWTVNGGAVGLKAIGIANAKCNLTFWAAFCRGVGCNWLVCLAVWLAIGAKTVVGKVWGIWFPIMAFVASGFEHCVANMYFIPMGIFLKGNADFLSMVGKTAADYANLTWGSFLVGNLLPVTLGNIVGGSFFVAALYWFVYLRGKE